MDLVVKNAMLAARCLELHGQQQQSQHVKDLIDKVQRLTDAREEDLINDGDFLIRMIQNGNHDTLQQIEGTNRVLRLVGLCRHLREEAKGKAAR